MTTVRRLAATTAAAALLSGAAVLGLAGQAAADEYVPAYRTIFYSDASHQTMVGRLVPRCQTWPHVDVVYQLVGTETAHSVETLAHHCGPDGPVRLP